MAAAVYPENAVVNIEFQVSLNAKGELHSTVKRVVDKFKWTHGDVMIKPRPAMGIAHAWIYAWHPDEHSDEIALILEVHTDFTLVLLAYFLLSPLTLSSITLFYYPLLSFLFSLLAF